MKPLQWEQGPGDVSVLMIKDSTEVVCKISHVSGSTEKLKFIWQVEASWEPFCIKQGYKNVLKMVIAVLSKTDSTLGFKGRCLCLPVYSSLHADLEKTYLHP